MVIAMIETAVTGKPANPGSYFGHSRPDRKPTTEELAHKIMRQLGHPDLKKDTP